MKCPSCSRPVDHEADTCYSCGFSVAQVQRIYGRDLLPMARISDTAHCLRKRDRDDLDEIMDRLQNRFPQLLFCSYLTTLENAAEIPSLGFWLVNHARVKGSEYARPNENALMVIVDLTNKQIGFSLGYFAEYLLGEEDAHRTLQAARPYLVNGDYGRALITLYKKLGRVLSRRARVLKKNQRQGRKPDYEIQNVPNLLDVPNHQPFPVSAADNVPEEATVELPPILDPMIR